MQTNPAEAVCVLHCPAALLSSISAVAKQHPFLGKNSQIICKCNNRTVPCGDNMRCIFSVSRLKVAIKCSMKKT